MKYTIRELYKIAKEMDALDIPCKIDTGVFVTELVNHEEEPKVYNMKNGKRYFVIFPQR